MRSYMIKISVSIAYEQNRPTGVASALRAQFGFGAKSALKMHCTKIFLRQKLYKSQYATLVQKHFDRPMGVASALIAQFVFCEKCPKNALYKNFFYQTKVVTINIRNFYFM